MIDRHRKIEQKTFAENFSLVKKYVIIISHVKRCVTGKVSLIENHPPPPSKKLANFFKNKIE